jgi:NADH-quinone oxidoreductase subunit L
MVTHAFFKALLFLGAGSVIHGMRDEQDMTRMGGLRRFMPVTALTFVVGWLAIAGVIPFAGFWSKDEILAKAWYSGEHALWAVGFVAALVTAFYMTRQVWLVFFGEPRWRADDDGHAPHESPATMLVPLVVLALLSVVGGAISLPFADQDLELLVEWLHPVFADVPEVHATSFAAGAALAGAALAVGIVGIVVARAVYARGLRPDGADPTVERLGGYGRVLERAYALDEGVSALVAGPGSAAAEALAERVDRGVIDGAVDGVGALFTRLAQGLRRVQTGYVRNYALAIVAGAVLVLVWFATRVVV